MTAKEKYIKDNHLGRLSKTKKDLIFAYEPWLSLDNCAVSAIYQMTGKYDDDIYSQMMGHAREHTILIYDDVKSLGEGLVEKPKHIGTVVDMRGWSDAE
jgi:hypothetical protein